MLEGVRSAETGRELSGARLDQQDRIAWYVLTHPGMPAYVLCTVSQSDRLRSPFWASSLACLHAV